MYNKSKLIKEEQPQETVNENVEEQRNEPANDIIDENGDRNNGTGYRRRTRSGWRSRRTAPEETKTQEQLDIEFVKQKI